MKKSSYIINTSRGEIINEEDLYKSLKNNKIKGAALDVLKNEGDNKFIKNSNLIKYAKNNKNLIITPHISGATSDSWKLSEIFIANEIKKIINRDYIKK